ncbi:hypothetical protein [Fulvimarina sp. MAC3]|uniref:hypothetical protein n=1 Tax=Fulvimarina sp. MAC3 TaxID=3148887 RepID=UPI0031FCE3A4
MLRYPVIQLTQRSDDGRIRHVSRTPADLIDRLNQISVDQGAEFLFALEDCWTIDLKTCRVNGNLTSGFIDEPDESLFGRLIFIYEPAGQVDFQTACRLEKILIAAVASGPRNGLDVDGTCPFSEHLTLRNNEAYSSFEAGTLWATRDEFGYWFGFEPTGSTESSAGEADPSRPETMVPSFSSGPDRRSIPAFASLR